MPKSANSTTDETQSEDIKIGNGCVAETVGDVLIDGTTTSLSSHIHTTPYVYNGNDWSIISSSEYVSPQDKIDERLSVIEERLAILSPNEELMEKYPALREAYEHYKTVEALVNDGKRDE